jgi:hypothetical protein
MQLNDAQKRQVAAWIRDGCSASALQARLATELGLNLTYMEVRLLLSELQLQPQDKEPASAPAQLGAPAPAKGPGTSQTPLTSADKAPLTPAAAREPNAASSKVTVSVDALARPGTIVSGRVTFTDGKRADWSLDNFGRLALAPEQRGYKPPEADIAAFQSELQQELARMGF